MNRDKLIELIRFTAGEIEPKEISIECAKSILIDFEKQFAIHSAVKPLKDETGYNNIDDFDSSWIEYINGNKKTL